MKRTPRDSASDERSPGAIIYFTVISPTHWVCEFASGGFEPFATAANCDRFSETIGGRQEQYGPAASSRSTAKLQSNLSLASVFSMPNLKAPPRCSRVAWADKDPIFIYSVIYCTAEYIQAMFFVFMLESDHINFLWFHGSRKHIL